jgi:hypothetical protein
MSLRFRRKPEPHMRLSFRRRPEYQTLNCHSGEGRNTTHKIVIPAKARILPIRLSFRRKPESPYTKHEIVIPAKAGTSLSPTPYFSSNKIDPEDSRMFIKTLQYSVSTPKVLTCVA